MNSAVKNITTKAFAYFLIGIMAMFIFNKVIFLHTHKLADGTVIEHAHPYNKANDSKPFKTHHHTNAEFIFFQYSGILFLVLPFAFAFFSIPNKTNRIFFLPGKIIEKRINLSQSRAPPVC